MEADDDAMLSSICISNIGKGLHISMRFATPNAGAAEPAADASAQLSAGAATLWKPIFSTQEPTSSSDWKYIPHPEDLCGQPEVVPVDPFAIFSAPDVAPQLEDSQLPESD